MLWNSIRESIERAVTDCTGWLRRIGQRQSNDAEWKALPGDERNKMAADIGASCKDLDTAIREGAGSHELRALLARPTLRHLRYSGEVLRDMERVCTFCT